MDAFTREQVDQLARPAPTDRSLSLITDFLKTAVAWWLAMLLAWIALCVPLFLVDLPPLGDYPNHLARMVLMSRLPDDPVLASFYMTNWAIIPDLAIDVFMPALVKVIPPLLAGKLLLAGILLLDIIGAAAYAACVHGRRTWWSLGAALAGYNIAFMMGFLNFNVSLGLAMLLAAGWIGLRRWTVLRAAAFAVAASALLFFCHLMGLFFFLALAGSFEASLLWVSLRDTGRSREMFQRTLVAAGSLAAMLVPVAVLYPLTGLSSTAGDDTRFLSPHEKLVQLIGPFVNYNFSLDALTACAVLGVLLAGLVTRRLILAPGAVAAVMGVALLYTALPTEYKGTGFLDTRLAVMLGFLAFTAFRLRLSPLLSRAVGVGLLVLFGLRVATVSFAWIESRIDVDNTRALVSLVQPGERVAQIGIGPDDVVDYWEKIGLPWRLSTNERTGFHMPGYFFIERSAFWPYLFTDVLQQPIVMRPPYDDRRYTFRGRPSRARLADIGGEAGLPTVNPYCAFDVVLFQDIWAEPHPATIQPNWLEFVAANKTAALYRVRAPRSCPVVVPNGA